MSSAINLDQVDPDGAIRETSHEAHEALADDGDTRLDFFKKAGVAGGAVLGGGALLGALVPGAAMAAGSGRPPSSFGKGDIGILNYALTLEYLEAAFYTEAHQNNQKKSFVKGDEQVFLDVTYRDERAHVKFLKSALGKKAVSKPKFDFGKTTSNRMKFLETSFALENTGVHAYLGQVANVKDPGTLTAASTIATIEARHASVIGLLLKGDKKGIAPDGPFDTPLPAKEILKRVKATGFIVG
jgi:hypothetical protein